MVNAFSNPFNDLFLEINSSLCRHYLEMLNNPICNLGGRVLEAKSGYSKITKETNDHLFL